MITDLADEYLESAELIDGVDFSFTYEGNIFTQHTSYDFAIVSFDTVVSFGLIVGAKNSPGYMTTEEALAITDLYDETCTAVEQVS